MSQEPFFQRFRWNDADALQRELVEARAAYSLARQTSDAASEIECAGRLGIALTAGDREREAVAVLESALAKARTLGEFAPVAWTLLHLATARQYLGEHAVAQTMFGEALHIAQRNDMQDVEHYILHHRGRCYAEQGDFKEARHCFERALEIRLALGEPRAERTRQALAALDDR